MSERGGESGPSAREAAFLSTLSQAPAPQPGGRRHSVVTISRVPQTLFSRNRRESIAAFPLGGATRILPGRRDSESRMGGPPSNAGSSHNLQLDIMDDIAEMKAKKVKICDLDLTSIDNYAKTHFINSIVISIIRERILKPISSVGAVKDVQDVDGTSVRDPTTGR